MVITLSQFAKWSLMKSQHARDVPSAAFISLDCFILGAKTGGLRGLFNMSSAFTS